MRRRERGRARAWVEEGEGQSGLKDVRDIVLRLLLLLLRLV